MSSRSIPNEEAMRPADQLYSGEAGARYLAQRQGATSDHNQRLRASLFRGLDGSGKTMLDFGCGTGGVLARLEAGRRIGIEVGEEAAAEARSKGIEVHSDLKALPDACIDVAISFHALEHVECPFTVLRELARVVKKDGHVRLIVPAELATETAQRSWYPNDDNHLYTWTPLLFGNLAQHSGLKVLDCEVAPMPTASRAVRLFSLVPPVRRKVHWTLSRRRNALNCILNAIPSREGRA